MKSFWSLAAVVVILISLYSQLPLGTAFEFSSDEGFEVMKPFTCNQGYVLYKEIWDDQPPVFTVLLAAAFKAFGTSILTARLIAAFFGVILIAIFHELIRRRSGSWCALLATFFLLSSPGVILLSVSVMQEVPAMAAGLLAAWLLFQWERKRHWGWLLASGAVMAVAMQIKLTAILLVPAIFIEFTLPLECKTASSSRLNPLVKNLLPWSLSFTVTLILVGLTLGKGSLEESWKSHTGDQFVPGLDRVADYQFNPQLLWNHVECVLAAAAGIGLALSRKRGREIIFPAALLLTDSLVHALHQPWWNYYYLHLAVPIAWLAGWAVNEVIQDILRLHAKYRLNFLLPGAWKQWMLCLLIALAITRSELRLEGMIKKLRQQPSADVNPIVKKMREYAGHARLAYSEAGLYAFHARLPEPPELAVITLKRFWSGQINTGEIIKICRQNKLKLIVLPKDKITEEWKDFLDTEYVRSASDDKSILFEVKQTE